MKKQIILSGGLGNQMFQYAFYRSLCFHGIRCNLNTDLYSVVKMHNGCELFDVFGIQNQYRSNRLSVLLTRLVYKFQLYPFVYKEEKYVYNENVYDTNASIYIGNWINETYFKNIEQEIRETFTFKNIDEANLELSEVMRKQNSVSIHIRRGDYLKIPSWNVCDSKYYIKAVNYINSRIRNPFFYVFSDDFVWSDIFMKDLGVNYKVLNHNRDKNSYKDLFLMSNCKHNINANSTFSWWGAWLNDNSRKIVISPKLWTKDTSENPACFTWIRI